MIWEPVKFESWAEVNAIQVAFSTQISQVNRAFPPYPALSSARLSQRADS